MQNTIVSLLLLTAVAILLIRKYLVMSLDMRFTIKDSVKDAIGIYKRAFVRIKENRAARKESSNE